MSKNSEQIGELEDICSCLDMVNMEWTNALQSLNNASRMLESGEMDLARQNLINIVNETMYGPYSKISEKCGSLNEEIRKLIELLEEIDDEERVKVKRLERVKVKRHVR